MKISTPAFPTWLATDSMAPGMTLRDYFAATAMCGLLSNGNLGDADKEVIARWAYEQSDAMIAERNK